MLKIMLSNNSNKETKRIIKNNLSKLSTRFFSLSFSALILLAASISNAENISCAGLSEAQDKFYQLSGEIAESKQITVIEQKRVGELTQAFKVYRKLSLVINQVIEADTGWVISGVATGISFAGGGTMTFELVLPYGKLDQVQYFTLTPTPFAGNAYKQVNLKCEIVEDGGLEIGKNEILNPLQVGLVTKPTPPRPVVVQ